MEPGPATPNEDADSLVAYLGAFWGLPLGSPRAAPAFSGTVPPSEVVRRSLRCGDLRLVRALPLWLTLVEAMDPLPADWSLADRRRLAYLCELAEALASLRCRRPPREAWAASVAGIQPGPWHEKVPLCDAPVPARTPSQFGERWGIEEPMTFPEYAAFQDQFLAVDRDRQCHESGNPSARV